MMYRLDRCRLLDRPTQSGRRDRLQSMADHAFVLANLERGRNSREQAYWISECVRAHEEEVLVHAKDEALPGAVDRVNERIVTVYGECSTWPVSLRCRLSTFCRSVAEQAECHALRSELLERSKSLLDTQVGQLAPRERRLVQKERAKVMRAEARALASGGQTDGAKALLDQAARQLRAALTEDPDPLTYLLYLRSLDQMHDQDRPVLSLTVSDDGLVSGRTRSIPPELSDAITACKAWLLKSGAREFSSDSLLALELWMLTRAWAAEGTLEIKASRAASQGKRSRSAALQAAYSERSAELDRLRQAYGDSAELTLRRVEVERQFVKFDAIESSTLVDSARVLSIFEESMFGHEPNVRIEWAKFLGVLGRLRDSVDLLRDLLADHLSSYHRRAVSIEFAAAVRELCARSALPDSQRGELLRHAKASLEAQGFGSRMARRVGLDLDVELRDPGVPWGALLSVLRLLLACRDSLEVPMHVLRDANASLGGVLSDRDSPNELIQWISRLLLRALLLEIPVAEIGPVQVAQTVCASLELLQPPSGNRHIVLQLWQAQAIVFACELVGSSVPFGTEAHTAQSELRRIRRLRRRALGPLGMAYDEAEARLAKFVE
ncbi:MAG: hypothetical protein M9894_00665 [Planctomycetes bacterium]|nr:hypothetical protein [Planctomycetota bacterium]